MRVQIVRLTEGGPLAIIASGRESKYKCLSRKWFVVPANARFSGFSGSYYCQNRAPAPSDINVVHVNTTYCQSDLQFLRFPKEFFAGLTYVVISLLINRRLIRFEYENGEEMDLNAFIRTADPHKRLLASVDEEFARDASVGCWVGEQGFDSILVVRDYVEPSSACTKYADPEVDSLSGLLLRFDMRLPMLLTISSTVFLQGGHGSSGSCCRGAFCARKEGYRCLARWKSLFLSGTVTRGFELNDGCLCANMIDHFTPSAFFKTVRGMEHEQLFTKFNVSAARNLSLSSEAKEESAVVAQLRAQVSGLEAVENSLRGEVASTKDHNVLLEQECNSLKLKGTGLESTIALKDIFWTPQGLRLAKIDADFTGFVVCAFKESFHPHLLKSFVAGRKMRKECTVGSSAGMSMGNVAVELSNKKDASTWDVMDLLRLDDAVAEALGMTDLQPDVSQLMVLVHHKQDRVVIGSQALSVALDICRGRVEKMERNLVERLPLLKDVFVSLDHPLSAEALIEPPVVVPATNALSTVVIVPYSGPSVSVEDYENPDLVDVVPKNVTPGPESEENIDASTGGDPAFSRLENEARDVVL
ncbi:hypothetical protein Tco_1428573 [Tanacetum coccineum]